MFRSFVPLRGAFDDSCEILSNPTIMQEIDGSLNPTWDISGELVTCQNAKPLQWKSGEIESVQISITLLPLRHKLCTFVVAIAIPLLDRRWPQTRKRSLMLTLLTLPIPQPRSNKTSKHLILPGKSSHPSKQLIIAAQFNNPNPITPK